MARKPLKKNEDVTHRIVIQLARTYSEAAIEALAQICSDEANPPAARVSAANSILDRAWGKPKEVDIEAVIAGVKTMTNEELLTLAASDRVNSHVERSGGHRSH